MYVMNTCIRSQSVLYLFLKGFWHLAIVSSLDPDLGDVAVVQTLVRKSGIHPHLVCWHPTEPNQELPTYESVTPPRDALINIHVGNWYY